MIRRELLASLWRPFPCDPPLPVVELDATINDPAFATACARELLANIARAADTRRAP